MSGFADERIAHDVDGKDLGVLCHSGILLRIVREDIGELRVAIEKSFELPDGGQIIGRLVVQCAGEGPFRH